MTATTRIDTTDMMAIHKVFRLACERAAHWIHGVAQGDETRTRLVGSLYDNVLGILRLHHGAEDALLWPLLQQRCPSQAALVARMESDHHAVDGPLARAEAALASWKRSPAGPAGDALVAALGTLGSELGSHLDVEDAEILPLAADHLTEAEWGSLPGHAMSRFTGDKWMIIGLVREHMSESQRAHMLAGMPPPGREMWLTTGARAFDDFTASLPRS